MGKHFSEIELDQARGMAPADIRDRLARARSPTRDRGPSLRAVQRALKGIALRRAKVETRGRKKTLTPREPPRA